METSLNIEILRSASGFKTFQKANNKGADETAWMRRLVCAFAFQVSRSI